MMDFEELVEQRTRAKVVELEVERAVRELVSDLN